MSGTLIACYRDIRSVHETGGLDDSSFANMLGGHLIVLVLISLIFLFSVMGQVVLGVTAVFSVLFAVFMNLITC